METLDDGELYRAIIRREVALAMIEVLEEGNVSLDALIRSGETCGEVLESLRKYLALREAEIDRLEGGFDGARTQH